MSLFSDSAGPIEELSWGLFRINGTLHGSSSDQTWGAGKDIRIVDGLVSPWRERRGHLLKKKMITGIDPTRVDILVIGTGIYGRIHCPKKLIRALHASGLQEIISQPTTEACLTFNQLYRAGRRVALLAHGTC